MKIIYFYFPQINTRSVTSWHNPEHTGELSVFCWWWTARPYGQGQLLWRHCNTNKPATSATGWIEQQKLNLNKIFLVSTIRILFITERRKQQNFIVDDKNNTNKRKNCNEKQQKQQQQVQNYNFLISTQNFSLTKKIRFRWRHDFLSFESEVNILTPI